ncbi:MAG: FliI/YscN family ATPase [Planctomycetes bacterium]|nr:FliI/YscN family ATPase [Planctomycetota bacterium]
MMKTTLLDKYTSVKAQGYVTSFSGILVKCAGLRVPIGALCRIKSTGGDKMAEVVAVDSEEISLMCIDAPYGIMVGNKIEIISTFQYVPVSSKMLGRVVDSFGKFIDGKDECTVEDFYPIFGNPTNPLERRIIKDILSTGVRAIDSFATCGKGQRIGIFSGSGVGKSMLMGMITRYTSADVVVVCLVGERGREVKEFLEYNLGSEGLKRAVVVVETSDKPPVSRYRAPFTATAIAEYFKDKGADVLLMMDSITRMANSKREIGLAIGEMPTTKGYTPTVFSDMPKLLERAGNFDNGTITGIYTVLVEQDDINDPIGDCARSILDGHIWLSRDMAHRGIYPACDILQSISRLMVNVTDKNHYESCRQLVKCYSVFKDSEDFITVGAYKTGTSKEIDASIKMKDKIVQLISQNMDESSDYSDAKAKVMELANYYRSLL